jgi:IclR family transcriptional regulator, pca regulon regulatory protein
VAGRGSGPDFVESLARGLDVLACFGADHRSMTLSEVASAAGLARPTARRLLLTLQELGYVGSERGGFVLTPKVLTLGMAYVGALGLWDIARPHLEALVRRTGESSSMAQLDGSDIVYVARVSVPKLIALRVDIGTRFPAVQTSQGSVAVPVRDGAGTVHAAMNVTVHAAETSTERLLADHLPLLLRTAGDVSAEWAMWQARPHVEVGLDAQRDSSSGR